MLYEVITDARERATSVYFPRRVIPMLPERLSNGLCSLNPEVDRLAMVCEMAITPRGEIARYGFFPAVIRSSARLTYTEVWQMLEAGAAAPGREAVFPGLQTLYAVFQRLAEARLRRGAIDFETVETRMIFDARGRIERIVPEVRNDAHRLIVITSYSIHYTKLYEARHRDQAGVPAEGAALS